MAFFEQLGKRISDAGQSMAQQTKNFADTTRLNMEISEKEKKIAQLYAAIGQAYYEAHKDDASAESADKIAAINALFAEIADNRDKIGQIKGVAKCASCGAEISPDALFCNSCGTKVVRAEEAKPAESAERACPACGATVAEGNAFCTSCGAKL